MYYVVASIMYADGLAPWNAGTSADMGMTKFGFCLWTRPTLEGFVYETWL